METQGLFSQSGLQVGVDLGVTQACSHALARTWSVFVSLGRFLDSTSQMTQQSKATRCRTPATLVR